jgi:hypothetical protein
MLNQLTPDEMEAVIPVSPTSVQYYNYINNALLNLERLILAVGIGAALLVFSRLFSETGLGFIFFLAGVLSLLYPFLWGPLYEISRRNTMFRELPYGYFFFGQVLSVDSYEVVVEEIERLGDDGELYIEEVREQLLELEVGDETGLSFVLKTRDEPRYESIVPRQSVIALVKSGYRDLSSPVVSEIYIVKLGQWVGDVSYLKREEFLDLANDLVEMA